MTFKPSCMHVDLCQSIPFVPICLDINESVRMLYLVVGVNKFSYRLLPNVVSLDNKLVRLFLSNNKSFI